LELRSDPLSETLAKRGSKQLSLQGSSVTGRDDDCVRQPGGDGPPPHLHRVLPLRQLSPRPAGESREDRGAAGDHDAEGRHDVPHHRLLRSLQPLHLLPGLND
jgi:hypothetical protein